MSFKARNLKTSFTEQQLLQHAVAHGKSSRRSSSDSQGAIYFDPDEITPYAGVPYSVESTPAPRNKARPPKQFGERLRNKK